MGIPHPILMAITIVGLLLLLIGRLGGATEYEPLGGYFDGELRVTPEFISVDGEKTFFKEMIDLNVAIGHHRGERTGRKGGPAYYQGVDNFISFRVGDQVRKVQFRMTSPQHIALFYNVLIKPICTESIQYQRKYLNFFNPEFRKLPLFREFVIRLLRERRIDCTEGLLIIGYSSDAEAKAMRAEYCC